MNNWQKKPKDIDISWPKSIMEFEGIEDFPTAEELRKGTIEKYNELF